MGHITCQLRPPSSDFSQLQSNSIGLMFFHTMRCWISFPLTTAVRESTISPFFDSPTKSRYPPWLSTQVCFHCPVCGMYADKLIPCRGMDCSLEKFSWMTQFPHNF